MVRYLPTVRPVVARVGPCKGQQGPQRPGTQGRDPQFIQPHFRYCQSIDGGRISYPRFLFRNLQRGNQGLISGSQEGRQKKGAPKCDVKEDPQKGVFVKNLTDVMVKDEYELQKVLDQGVALRTVAETKMNDNSSRSHSIFSIVIEMSSQDPHTGKELMRVGKLNLVDLAGSERQKKTGASGAVLKEEPKSICPCPPLVT